MRRRIVATAGVVALVAAVGAGVVHAADRSVTISGFRFSPETVTVNVGDTVTWTNRDGQAHTATSGSAWSTGDIAGGKSKSITFRTAGTFDYICAIHPTMTGTLVVRAGSAPATDTGLASGAPDPDTTNILVILTLASLGGALIGARRFRRTPGDGQPA
jgi:plastocyanin